MGITSPTLSGINIDQLGVCWHTVVRANSAIVIGLFPFATGRRRALGVLSDFFAPGSCFVNHIRCTSTRLIFKA